MSISERLLIVSVATVIWILLWRRFWNNNTRYRILLWIEWGLVICVSVADQLTTYYALVISSKTGLYESVPLSIWFLQQGGFNFLWLVILGRIIVVILLSRLLQWICVKFFNKREIGSSVEQALLVVYIFLAAYVAIRNVLLTL